MAQGAANWTVAAIPLSVGANVITVTASDANQDHASQSVTVTSQPPSRARGQSESGKSAG